MKKLTLLLTALFTITFTAPVFAQSFTFDPGNIVTEYVELESYKNIQINMVHQGFNDITFGWVTIENNMLDKWEYSSCDNGGCYSLLPDSATVGPLADTVPGYVRLTVNPRDQIGSSTVKLFIYDIKYPDEGKFVTFDIIAVEPTGIYESETESLRIYPNPATDYMMFENNSIGTSAFEFIDMAGKTVFKDIVNPHETSMLTLDTYPKGIYFVRFQKASSWETKRIIIQ
ncbi:MAG: T9SS type A sorting domain-containing protein [Bacteroidales bacterium]|nr:T9SS type A sorting domain-containing protein [Bacteroidales bacterium]